MPRSPTAETVFLEIDDDFRFLQAVLETTVLALKLSDLLFERLLLTVLALFSGGTVEQSFLALLLKQAKGGVVDAFTSQDSSDLSALCASIHQAQDAAFVFQRVADA